MTSAILFLAALASATITPGHAHPALAVMHGRDRVLLVFAPSEHDEQLALQRGIIRQFAAGAADRDVRFVQVVADRVDGASDRADALRHRYHAVPDRFAALLIGKDGHVALRQDRPLTAERLTETIDAMPMRQEEVARRKRG